MLQVPPQMPIKNLHFQESVIYFTLTVSQYHSLNHKSWTPVLRILWHLVQSNKDKLYITHTHTPKPKHTHTHTHTPPHTHTQTHTHTHPPPPHTHKHTHTHTHTHTHPHTHKHTHTHTRWFLWFTGTLHRRNGFYTVQAVCAIVLHLPYT